MAHKFKKTDKVFFRVAGIQGTGTIVGKAVTELPVLGSAHIVQMDKPIEVNGETEEFITCFEAWMEPVTSPTIEAGEHLRIIRTFIQCKCINGSSVTWGSTDILNFSSGITVKHMEELAQKIADTVKPKEKKEDRGFFPLQIRYADSREPVIVEAPGDIDSGKKFTVLKTNYKE